MKANPTVTSQEEPVVTLLGVEYAADELDRSIDELVIELERLEFRLHPVLDDSSHPLSERAVTPCHGSPLAGRTRESTLRIRGAVDRIAHLIQRMS